MENINKWEKAPDSIKDLYSTLSGNFDLFGIDDELLTRVLDDYNEIEMKYKEACDKISQYEEENRILREQRTKKCCDLRALERRLYDKGNIIKELREHYEEELRIREKEKDEKDKLIDELNSKIEELNLRIITMYSCYGLNPLGELNGKIKALEKENKELKDALNVDRELGKYVGKCVADSIQEGWKNGAYELHPGTRFDIHVEETKNASTSFNRYSVPNIVVAFNNTQTEMERDTAQHEYEELDKKVDRLWRVNDELNRKIKELKKDNKELKATLAVCAVDANTAKKLCDGIVSKVKRTRDNKEEN